ncbi:NAD(P)-dependent oxidoreductase [Cupriavidus yeoncheonensis]|uniref:NAD(P)-dependent oxidoreductase n=1 Tax=Cupriavidus yeoncheonensis TaxID=1462994 RepID=UPI0022A66BF9|nr:NAD(P)-dependent oxidoreductase [Cupriavidus yeoncheonensis]
MQSGILVCTLPLTLDTPGLLDRARLSLLSRNAYLVNVGRGEHVVEPDPLDLLDAGHLSGATLDVFKVEPAPPEHPLWNHSRVLAAPHIAARPSFDVIAHQCVENVISQAGHRSPSPSLAGHLRDDRGAPSFVGQACWWRALAIYGRCIALS